MSESPFSIVFDVKVLHNFTITTSVIRIAITSAIGAAQKIPVTPPKIGTISEKIISSTSLKMGKGAAAFACPMDCRKIAQTFCTHVKIIKER